MRGARTKRESLHQLSVFVQAPVGQGRSRGAGPGTVVYQKLFQRRCEFFQLVVLQGYCCMKAGVHTHFPETLPIWRKSIHPRSGYQQLEIWPMPQTCLVSVATSGHVGVGSRDSHENTWKPATELLKMVFMCIDRKNIHMLQDRRDPPSPLPMVMLPPRGVVWLYGGCRSLMLYQGCMNK